MGGENDSREAISIKRLMHRLGLYRPDVEDAFVSVNAMAGTVEAIVSSRGRTTVCSRAPNCNGLHAATRTWLHMAEMNAVIGRPATGNVEFVGRR